MIFIVLIGSVNHLIKTMSMMWQLLQMICLEILLVLFNITRITGHLRLGKLISCFTLTPFLFILLTVCHTFLMMLFWEFSVKSSHISPLTFFSVSLPVCFTLYTLTSVYTFSILFSIHFLRCRQKEFMKQSGQSFVGCHIH